jgi:hypothetical protein
MRRFLTAMMFTLVMTIGVPAVYSQNEDASRVKTRERLGALLEQVGPKIKVAFRQSDKQPFNFVGVMKEGLTNSDRLEIVIIVGTKETIGFRIFPHYKGGYINVDKAKNPLALMRQLLRLSEGFLFWAMDDTSDVFAGYTFTLESGFPEEAVTVVLRNIVNLDKLVGDMKAAIDGSID